MADLTSNEGQKPKLTNYSALRIEPRLLVTDTLSLAIAHVVTLETDSSHEPEVKKRDPKTYARIAIAVAVGVIGAGVALILTSWIAAAVAAAAATVLAIIAMRTPDIAAREAQTTYHLNVMASLGGSMQFSARRKETVDAVRRIISDRINDQGGAAVHSIDFEKGTILNVGLGRVEPTGDVIGPGGALATGARHAPPVDFGRSSPAELPRSLPPEPPRPLATEAPPRSLTARLGNGVAGGDNPYAVDYSKVLPIVSDWNRYYENQQELGRDHPAPDRARDADARGNTDHRAARPPRRPRPRSASADRGSRRGRGLLPRHLQAGGILVWRFRSSPSLAARWGRELLNQSHTSYSMILVSLLNPKFASPIAAKCVRTSGSGH